jgi:acetoin utilization protein AcuB
MIPPLRPTDSVDKAVQWMEEFRTHQLPVVENNLYKGLVSETVLLESVNPGTKISDFPPLASDFHVQYNQHFYDVIKIATDNALEIIAVLDENNEYLGIISVKDTITAFAQTISVQSAGGILVISLKEIDYSLAEISRLVEGNHAKIICSYVSSDALDPEKIKVTIKINKLDLNHIIATLERYDYKIIAKFQEAEYISTDKERLDILLKYLSL